MEPIKQDLRVDGVIAHQLGVRRPHVHANNLKRLAAPFAHFLGKERPHRPFGSVVSHPQQDPALQIKANSRIQILNNTLTNRKGMIEGLVNRGLLAQKEAREKALVEWIAADPARQKEYGDVFPALAEMQAEKAKTLMRDAVLLQLLGTSPTSAGASPLLHAAHTAHRLSLERPKPDQERLAGLQQRDFSRIREQQERALDPNLGGSSFVRKAQAHTLWIGFVAGLFEQLDGPSGIVRMGRSMALGKRGCEKAPCLLSVPGMFVVDDGIAFEEAARRVGLMRRLVQGGVYAAPRVGGENGVLAPIWYEIAGEETYDWHLRYVEAGCLSTEHNVRDLIEACRSGAAKLERIVARVALYDLATDKVSWLDGASGDPAGRGVLMVVPCFDDKQCVASETTDETSNAILVPCRDRAACDQFLRHLDFLAEEAFWLPLDRAARGELDHVYRYVGEGGRERTMPSWRFERHVVWGMTYGILSALIQRVVGPARPSGLP